MQQFLRLDLNELRIFLIGSKSVKILHNVFPELNIFILHLNAFCFFVESEAFIQSLLNEQLWDDYLQTEYKLKIPQNNIISENTYYVISGRY